MVEENKDVALEEENVEQETPSVEENEEQTEVENTTVENGEALKNELAEWKQKAEEYENRFLRLQADMENMRRRNTIDREAAAKYRSQSLINDILPVLDNFERALQTSEEDEKTKSILDGMEMVYRQLLEALVKEGVEVIEAVGQQFDPHFHQAVMNASDPEQESNVVLQEFQKGYLLKDKVIRPSMVQVNQ